MHKKRVSTFSEKELLQGLKKGNKRVITHVYTSNFMAIEKLITNAINEKEYTEKDIFFHNEQWHCYDAHSQLSATTKEVLLESLNRNIKLTNKQILESSHIIITLGTAWAYRYIETDTFVANCHKVPQKQFLKELLSVESISDSLEATITLIRNVNEMFK